MDEPDPRHPARELFTERFTLLLAQAGDPPLRRVAQWVADARARDERGRPLTVPAQRISDWRRGRNVPASFSPLAAVVRPLIHKARASAPDTPVDGLYDLRAWQRWWHDAATSPRAAEDAEDTPSPGDGDLSPYPGLAPFRQEDARWFFGRDASTTKLMAHLSDAMRTGGPVVVIGPSGVGKSSLLRAGLTTALTRRPRAVSGAVDWLVETTSPGATPLAQLTRHVPELAEPLATGADDDAVREAVAAHARRRGGHAARLVLIVDQFEEVFTECEDHGEVRRFIHALQAVATPSDRHRHALVVIGVRADFYEHCLDHPVLVEALQARSMALGPMTVPELREAIAQPAKRAGLKVEPGLVDVMLRDLGVGSGSTQDGGYTSGALPLLSHALLATWQRRQNGRLTVAGYRSAGAIHGAIAVTAEQTWAQLAPRRRDAARAVLLRLVHLGPNEHDSRRRRTRRELLEVADDLPSTEAAIDALAKARLITLDAESVEMTHEALLRAWPRLRKWIDQDRASTLLRQRVEEDAETWAAQEHDPSLLYRGARLETAAQDTGSTPLTRTAQRFLAASQRHRRRRVWRARAAVAALCVLAVIASSAAFIAFDQRNEAEFRQLLAEADRLSTVDASLAAQLTLVAHRVRPDDEHVRSRLLATQNTPLATKLVGHTGAVHQTSFSPDGRFLATAGYDRTVRLWDVRRGVAVGEPLTGHRSWVTSATFSPDGRTLVTAGDDRTFMLWDVADPRRPAPTGAPVEGGGGTIYQVAFSPDGTAIATAHEDRAVRLWDVRDRANPRPVGDPLTGAAGPVRTVAFSPDGSLLAAGSDDGTARLWQVSAHPTPVNPLPLNEAQAHSGTVHSVAFSPDSRLLVTGGEDKLIRLWSTDNGLAPVGQPLTGHTSSVWQVAFSPDGRVLASAASDTGRLWNVSEPSRWSGLGRPLAGHTSGLSTVAFSPDGRTVATGSSDYTARLWSLPPTALVGHSDSVNALRFTADGQVLASGSADGTARLWDTAEPGRAEPSGPPIKGHTSYINYLAISPDGRTLATASGDRTTKLWDVADRNHPAPAGPPLPVAIRYRGPVAFSPDGRVLATGDDDHSTRLWDVTDPAAPATVGAPLTGHTGYVNGVAFRPDGQLLATASSDKTVRLWHTTPAAIGSPLTGHTGDVLSLAFHPDGTVLATGSDDRTVRLWDVTTPDRPVPLGAPLTGFEEFVGSVAFSPDGTVLAAGSGDGAFRLWHVADPAHPVPLGGPVSSDSDAWLEVVFDPRGRHLATGSGDGVTRLWNLDHAHAADRVCATSRGVLTEQTWAQHVPQFSFRPPCR